MSTKLGLEQIVKNIDHTLLKATATSAHISQLCAEAQEFGFYSVCVNSRWIDMAASELQGSASVAICVVGFPLGANLSQAKAYEAAQAQDLGAAEIDMVMDIGSAKTGDWSAVGNDIAKVVRSIKIPLKVILETCYLSDPEIEQACKVAMAEGAAFVKTSTGFGSAGATVDHIKLMRRTVGMRLGVKASGGIRNLTDFEKMLEAGASRVGVSASVDIVREFQGINTNRGSSHGY